MTARPGNNAPAVTFHLGGRLSGTDFLLQTQLAHLFAFPNRHYCTPLDAEPTPAPCEVSVGALYGALEQLCGNQTCTVLIFKRNMKVRQTIRHHEPDPT